MNLDFFYGLVFCACAAFVETFAVLVLWCLATILMCVFQYSNLCRMLPFGL